MRDKENENDEIQPRRSRRQTAEDTEHKIKKCFENKRKFDSGDIEADDEPKFLSKRSNVKANNECNKIHVLNENTKRRETPLSLIHFSENKADRKRLRNLPLPILKTIAAIEGVDSSWQKINEQGKLDLCKILVNLKTEQALFEKSVRSAIDNNSIQLRFKKALKKKTAWSKADREKFTELMPTLVGSSVHIIPNGSGVIIDKQNGLILTCAHCLTTQEEDDEEDRIHRRGEARTDEAKQNGKKNKKKIGRCKNFITSDGEMGIAKCLISDELTDVAVLKIESDSCYEDKDNTKRVAFGCQCKFQNIFQSPLAKDYPPKNAKILTCGNPYDWDLELPEGAKPRRMGYHPFFTSAGKFQGVSDRAFEAQHARIDGLGLMKHSCWTYWGHSGAALFDNEGSIIGLHNSWNPSNTQRHAVALMDILELIKRIKQ